MSYGIAEDGQLIHIADVPRGLACNCWCASCSCRLVARQGPIRTQHFAHYSARECASAWETTLHLLAKQTLVATRQILLPAAIARHEQDEEIVAEATVFTYDSVRVEVGLGLIRPDIVVARGKREWLVEIAVTHFCDAEKIAELRSRNLPTIEIDLSSVPRIASHEEHVEQILSAAPRAWLHNAKIVAAEDRLRETDKRRKSESLARRTALWRVEANNRFRTAKQASADQALAAAQREFIAKQRQQELSTAALRAFRDSSRADLWMRATHTSLGAPPIQACVTTRGMEDCLRLLSSLWRGGPRFGPQPRKRRRL